MYFCSDPNQKDSLWITMFHPQSVQLIFQDVPQSVLLCNMTFELRNVVFKRFPGIPVPSDGGWEWSPLQSKIFRTWSIKFDRYLTLLFKLPIPSLFLKILDGGISFACHT